MQRQMDFAGTIKIIILGQCRHSTDWARPVNLWRSHVRVERRSCTIGSQRLSAKLLAKFSGDVHCLVEMRIDPQCRLKRLQRRLQISALHVDHAKAAESPEMPWFKIDHAGDVAA